MGYLDGERAGYWLNLITYLAIKYPALESISFHFYCSCENYPYYIMWNRSDGIDLKILKVYIGSSKNDYWFIENTDSKYRKFIFDKNMYKNNWTQCTYELIEYPNV